MDEALIQLKVDDVTGIATLTFDRPAVFNALDIAMARAFRDAVMDIAERSGVRCVVLTGAGKAFMAGGDVGAFVAAGDGAGRVLNNILDAMHPAILTLRAMDAPIVAALNGTAAGAGFSIVLAADYVIAHPAAKLVLAYDKLAVPPDCGGSWFLARKIGRSHAFDLMLTGEALDASQALEVGIVNKVSGPDDFAETVQGVALQIAQGPTLAYGHFKRLMDADLPLAAHLEMERAGFVSSTATDDFRSATQAFVGKQRPTYRGK